LRLKRAPKYSRKSAPGRNKLDYHQILRFPVTNETAMKKIEENNTLVFVVDLRSNKCQIKEAIKKMYNVTPVRVNTLVKPNGQKKAFVKIPKDVEAVDVANKIGFI
jgi:large subunit ribosomal protein L23Ae